MPKQRILYYDAIKVLAIFLVCFYHFSTLNLDFIKGYIYVPNIDYFIGALSSMGVPLFFMVNGALLLNKNLDMKKHIGKIYKIFVLLICWRFITVLILIPKFHLQGFKFIDFVNLLFSSTFPGVGLNHLWYLNALFCIYLIFPLIKPIYDQKKDNKQLNYLLIVLFFFGFCIDTTRIVFDVLQYKFSIQPINSDSLKDLDSFKYTYAIFYFVVGGLIGDKLRSSSFRISSLSLLGIFISGWAALAFWGALLSKIKNTFFDPVFAGYPTVMTLVMSVSIFCLFSRANWDNNFITKSMVSVSNNTLGIYLIHWIIGYLIMDMFLKFMNHFSKTFMFGSLITNTLHAIILLVVPLCIALILKRIPLIRKLISL